MARTLIKTIGKPVKVVPVGTLIESMLTEAQFQAENGTEWVLADGRGVAGSTYEAITGNANIPDARGQFLRGKNNGRIGTYANPDGDLALGQMQVDQLKSHRHTVFGGGGSTQRLDAGNGGFMGSTTDHGYLQTNGQSEQLMGTYGGNETRPKNITVNIFIKIN